jgi:V/A-type H+-transporting ATPase subunit A
VAALAGWCPAAEMPRVAGRLAAAGGALWPRPVARRLPADMPLNTGQRAVDLLFPVARGSTVAVPGGFGTGKTMPLQQIAKWCDTDVIVYVGCGERGNKMADVIEELAELTDPRTGGRLADPAGTPVADAPGVPTGRNRSRKSRRLIGGLLPVGCSLSLTVLLPPRTG